MTNKERKQVRRALKRAITNSEHDISLVNISDKYGCKDTLGESAKAREILIASLKSARQEITDNIDLLIAEIDEAIKKMS